MKIRNKNEKGFTLIEVIVTLVLVGITAALAGMWIVSVVNGYIFTKTNASTVQKAQLTMTRLVKEFAAIKSVTAGTATQITYTRSDASGIPVTSNVLVSGTDLLLNGSKLTDSVNSFELTYCDNINSASCPSPAVWSLTSRIIEIKLKLKGANDIESEFIQRVAPRNI